MTRKSRFLLLFLVTVAVSSVAYASITVFFRPTIIMSDSMFPVLQVGDVVLIDATPDHGQLEAGARGDIVLINNRSIFLENSVPTYMYDNIDDSTPIIHRIIEKKRDGDVFYFITKGDNNMHADGCLKYKDAVTEDYGLIEYNASDPVWVPQTFITGKVLFIIPFIGWLKILSPILFIHVLSAICFIFIKDIRVKGVHLGKKPRDLRISSHE